MKINVENPDANDSFKSITKSIENPIKKEEIPLLSY